VDELKNFRVVYLSWPPEETTGGIKLVFRHVELLLSQGLNAAVATDGESVRPTWFSTTAPVIGLDELDPVSDILVFPENHEQWIRDFATWNCPKIVYCQNQFMVFRGLAGRACYGVFGVRGILALGRAATEFCVNRFPELPTFSIPGLVDQGLFRFERDKKLQIAFAPRKRQLEAAVIHDLLRSNAKYREVPWIPIDGLSESQVSSTLKQSAVYLSLQRLESLGLSALEAMSTGCTVAGFAGIGGREYATEANGFWADEDDCVACADQLVKALDLATSMSPRHADMLESGFYTAARYNKERLSNRLLKFWKPFTETGKWPDL